jgi:hypothetical protein
MNQVWTQIEEDLGMISGAEDSSRLSHCGLQIDDTQPCEVMEIFSDGLLSISGGFGWSMYRM